MQERGRAGEKSRGARMCVIGTRGRRGSGRRGGVFDPGINALSILTEILPAPVHLTYAELDVPSNRETPSAARLTLAGAGGTMVAADFDWRQEGPQTWEIRIETDKGVLHLSSGGAELSIDEQAVEVTGEREYPSIYRRFAMLLAEGESDVDLSPLIHVADAFMLGRRPTVEAFHDSHVAFASCGGPRRGRRCRERARHRPRRLRQAWRRRVPGRRRIVPAPNPPSPRTA